MFGSAEAPIDGVAVSRKGVVLSDKKRVLVTGMAGQIGGIIRRRLGDRYELSGIDRMGVEGVAVTVADIADIEAIRPAFEGIDAVVHLGADPSPRASWDSVLRNNIVGTRNVYEAARLAGVKRIVFASSNHVVGNYPLRKTRTRRFTTADWAKCAARSRRSQPILSAPIVTTASASLLANRWGATSTKSTAYR